MSRGIIIAAPGSGSGKTTLTLALLRRLRDSGISVASGKVGPDYIDPAYHAAASGRVCHNLDTWSMADRTLSALIADLQRDSSAIVVEGVMGLFDGAPDGRGSAADLSRRTGWPVVLVVDASGMAASVAALVHGFTSFDPGVEVAGVIFNRTGSARHGELLRRAMQPTGIPVFGCVTRSECLELPDRHLGLVQAREHPDLEGFLARAAAQVGREVDTGALLAAARPARVEPPVRGHGLPVLGRRTAVARDDAFAFCYPYVLDAWRRAGCKLSFFSPLDDEPPREDVDAVYLPGGYPELHGARLAGAGRFLAALRRSAERGAVVYGECGGYMVLGERLVDGDGVSHRMAGLLPVATSFESPRLSLGYREVALAGDGTLGRGGTRFRGHEFHFASVLTQAPAKALFRTFNAEMEPLGDAGLRVGSAMGSFVHLMDRCAG
ncbi:MAG: cobyrinate a,c-diamide synthase [Chromatiales bacterium]|nr:cobyrinate a,c-diamide synthase [Chromatiales bacterium]